MNDSNRLSKSIASISIGFFVTYLMLGIIAGSSTVPLLVISGSIVCTLGVALIVWVPIFWLTGKMVLAGLELLGFAREMQGTRPPERDLAAIVHYIHRCRSKGANDDQITMRLREQGWTYTEINRAFQLLPTSSNS